MLFNVLMLVGMYPVVIILYFVYRMNAKNRNGVIFGVRIPKEEGTAQEFLEVTEEKRKIYYRRMRRIFFIFLIIPLVCFFVPHISIQFTIWMFWLLAAIVCLQIPYVRANGELSRWKKERRLLGTDMRREEQSDAQEKKNNAVSDEMTEEGGMQESRRTEPEGVRHFELSGAGTVRRVRAKEFMPPVVLAAAVVLVCIFLRERSPQSQFLWVAAVFALCTPMFYAIAAWMDRQRTAVISRDSAVNLNFARAKKQIWKSLWLQCAWGNTAFTAFIAAIALMREAPAGRLVWGCAFYSAALLALCARAVVKSRRLEERYDGETDVSLGEDDDADWLWGCVYYKKSDRRTLVEARNGFGTSTNMATPVGKGLTIFGLGMLLLLPAVCIWMLLLEFTPIRLELRENYLVAEQLKTDYRIPVENITELELISELPELSKNSGTGMDNLYKGDWHIVYAGDCEVFLNPQNGLFLKFNAGGELYYMSASDDGQTRAVYDALLEVVP